MYIDYIIPEELYINNMQSKPAEDDHSSQYTMSIRIKASSINAKHEHQIIL